MSAAKKREFERIHPKKQVIKKTDVSKVHNTWRGNPHIVSKGAQTNFAKFGISTKNGSATRRNLTNCIFKRPLRSSSCFSVSNEKCRCKVGIAADIVPISCAIR
mgnify:CR=1 FL=1